MNSLFLSRLLPILKLNEFEKNKYSRNDASNGIHSHDYKVGCDGILQQQLPQSHVAESFALHGHQFGFIDQVA